MARRSEYWRKRDRAKTCDHSDGCAAPRYPPSMYCEKHVRKALKLAGHRVLYAEELNG